MSEAIFVLTIEPPEVILEQGGTKHWKLQPGRARECDYVVCVQNRNLERKGWAWCTPTEPDKSAFLVGHISDVVPSEEPGRFLIKIDSFSLVHVPNVWGPWRFPVRYMSLSDAGIDQSTLNFQPLPERSETTVTPRQQPAEVQGVHALTEAKERLAAIFGVDVSAIEITIRA